jgi:hypothetical protein
VNSYQNCNNVIENFYSIFFTDEIFIQEKINKGPNFISFYIKVHHIKNKCRIERILPSYNNIIVKIVKMLKVGKQNLLNNYLRKFYPVPNATALEGGFIKLINLGYLFLLGYLLSVETNNWLGLCLCLCVVSRRSQLRPRPKASVLLVGYAQLSQDLLSHGQKRQQQQEPQISELLLISQNTNNNPCPSGDGEIIKIFKQKCKELFKLNKSHNKIILDLAKLINQTLVTASKAGSNSYRIKRFMKNFIHKRS